MPEHPRPLLCFVAAHPMTVQAFLVPHLQALQGLGRLVVMTNSPERELLARHGLDAPVVPAPIERAIHPLKDLRCLAALHRSFQERRPDAVHTITPKAGLLGMLAAWAARVPVRVHSFTGQVWVTRRGPMRWLLMLADRCVATLATDVLVDSPSQRAFLIRHGIVSEARSAVLGPGSICGVDTARFRPDAADREALRAELGLGPDAVALLYLGRLNRDKGLLDLADAFGRLAPADPRLRLLVVGPDEEAIFEAMQRRCGVAADRVVRVGYTTEPERYMRAADVFCLPSYREGFGSSVIEAAACGVPAVASRIYGLTDAVVEGETGWLHAAGDVDDLAATLQAALADPAALRQRGEQARAHAAGVFAQAAITGAMVRFYADRLGARDATHGGV